MTIDETIFWIGHAGFYIKTDDATVFIDPFKVSDKVREKADLVLVTHAHFDHNSKHDIDRIATEGTKFIGANKCLEEYEKIHVSKPGFRTKFRGIGIEAVHAYNTEKERQGFHPKAENWVGYVLDIGGMRIYHAGDTDNIPEMEDLKDIDVALLPMGGKYTMTMDEALSAAKRFNPKTIVPMHYKMLLGEAGSRELERSVRSKAKNARIMKEVQDPVYSF